MDNFSDTFNYMMERAAIVLWYCMLAAFAEKTLEAEREKVKEAIGHEPTQETWQDYYALKQERENSQKTHQREIDREKTPPSGLWRR